MILHIVQPFARLYGRIAHGLAPWRKRGSNRIHPNLLFKSKLTLTHWSESWKSAEQWLQEIENNLIQARVRVRRGGQYDKWDLHVTCGFFSSAKGLLTIEEHGSNKQLLRFKCKPEYSLSGIELTISLAILSVLAILHSSYLAGFVLGSLSVLFIITYFTDKARALYALSEAFLMLSTSVTIPLPAYNAEENTEDKKEAVSQPVSVSDLLLLKNKTRQRFHQQPDTRQKRVLEREIDNQELNIA